MLIAGGDENGWSLEEEANEEEWRTRDAEVAKISAEAKARQAQHMGQDVRWARSYMDRGTFFLDCHCCKHLMWFQYRWTSPV
jgi:hypothetical protein